MGNLIYLSFINSNILIYIFCFITIERPSRPVLSMSTNHPFVGDNITFTCTSEAQRWPIGIPSSLTYTFFGKGERRNGVLMINSLTMSDRNNNITCQSADELGKVSDISKSITLNPFCKFYVMH